MIIYAYTVKPAVTLRRPQVLCLVNFSTFHNNDFCGKASEIQCFFAKSPSDPGLILPFWHIIAFAASSFALPNLWTLVLFQFPFPDKPPPCVDPPRYEPQFGRLTLVLPLKRQDQALHA